MISSTFNSSINTERHAAHYLIIAGNGFDLYHGLETRYCHYRRWLEKRDRPIAVEFGHFDYAKQPYNSKHEEHGFEDALWSNLEESLGIDWDGLCADYIERTYPDISEENPGWDDFWIELEVQLGFIKKLTRRRFREWVESIDVTGVKPRLALPIDAAYITFNYTPTLEYVYDVHPGKILHIHGNVLNDSELLQFGSPDNNPNVIKGVLEGSFRADDFYGSSIEQGLAVVLDRCVDTWKNIRGNYSDLNRFLHRFSSIEIVVIMGNSFNGVDKPYYHDVLAPQLRSAEWVFCEHEHCVERLSEIIVFCYELGIVNYRMTSYAEFESM